MAKSEGPSRVEMNKETVIAGLWVRIGVVREIDPDRPKGRDYSYANSKGIKEVELKILTLGEDIRGIREERPRELHKFAQDGEFQLGGEQSKLIAPDPVPRHGIYWAQLPELASAKGL